MANKRLSIKMTTNGENTEFASLVAIPTLWTIAVFVLILSLGEGYWEILGYLVSGFLYFSGVLLYLEERGTLIFTSLAFLVGLFSLTISTSSAMSTLERLFWIPNGLFFTLHPLYKHRQFKKKEEEKKEKRRQKYKEKRKKKSKPFEKKDSSNLSKENQNLTSIEDQEFEKLVADIWEDKGWNTEVTQKSMDKGVDVRAQKYSPYQRKILIQAKNFSEGNRVGSEAVQQYNSLRDQEDNVDEVLIVTTSDFTSQAEELAESLNVKLIDRDDLKNIIEELDDDLTDLIQR